MNKFFLFLIVGIPLACSLFYSCDGNSNGSGSSNREIGKVSVWADTIIYDVLIHNPDNSNTWETKKLSGVNNKQIVDDIFDLVYNGQRKAYHYLSHEAFSIEDIKSLELSDSFDRSKVGKLEFTERWTYANGSNSIKKEIISLLVAYEIYNESGQLRGYKAAFYLKDF